MFSFSILVQNRVVSCIGTDADNIRPAQRALQLFKNASFLALLMGTGPTSSAPKSFQDSKNLREEATGNDFSRQQSSEESLRMLLPALFRGGQLCWNPTVNKMTGLALNNLKVKCTRELLVLFNEISCNIVTVTFSSFSVSV